MSGSVTVVVPSFARKHALRECLAALAVQEGGPYRTIIVDDGSPEPLAPVCAEFGDWVQCVRQVNGGPASARNLGARSAAADLLCFTDDDCRPWPGWVKAMMDRHKGDETLLVGGTVENALPDNLFAEASQSITDWISRYYEASSDGVAYFTSNNIACSKSGFEAIGGFNETFPLAAGEDRDFAARWRRHGGRLVTAPAAGVDHAHPLTLRRYWKQHYNYGRGAWTVHKLSAHRGDQHGRPEKPHFHARLLVHPVTMRWSRKPYQLTALVALSQAATAAGYLRQAIEDGRHRRKAGLAAQSSRGSG